MLLQLLQAEQILDTNKFSEFVETWYTEIVIVSYTFMFSVMLGPTIWTLLKTVLINKIKLDENNTNSFSDKFIKEQIKNIYLERRLKIVEDTLNNFVDLVVSKNKDFTKESEVIFEKLAAIDGTIVYLQAHIDTENDWSKIRIEDMNSVITSHGKVINRLAARTANNKRVIAGAQKNLEKLTNHVFTLIEVAKDN